MTVPSNVTANTGQCILCPLVRKEHTLDFLALVITHSPCNFHVITNKLIPARVMHAPLHSSIELDYVHSHPCAPLYVPHSIVQVLDLDGIHRAECDLPSPL